MRIQKCLDLEAIQEGAAGEELCIQAVERLQRAQW